MQNEKTLKFIDKAVLKHGDKFDYSLVDYTRAKDKATIICKDHGQFEQTANSHLSGIGCPRCRGRGKTLLEVLSLFMEAHGDRYDYVLVDSTQAKAKVTIICRVHGEYQPSVEKHISGNGCPKCVGQNKTTEEYINEANDAHGYRYDYRLLEYIKNSQKVTIVCKDHGEFQQQAGSHLSGVGCPRCSGQHERTTDDFIVESREAHGDRYDYSLSNYRKMLEKVTIICPVHGEFEQQPAKHIHSKQGCPKCAGQNKTTEEYINEADEIHKGRYDYSKTIFKGANDKVTIICKDHGEFQQRAIGHLSGKGCLSCRAMEGHEKQRLTQNEFLDKCILIHGDTYDYSKTYYINAKNKVTIICKDHIEFEQMPFVHLGGSGCPKCMGSKGEKSVGEWLEKEAISFEQEISFKKIGFKYDGLNRLRFDFVLYEHKLIIEVDGEQHFKPIDFQGKLTGEELQRKFEKDILHDMYKNEACLSSEYCLLRIPFWAIDSIEDILREVIYGDRALMLNTYSYQANMDMFESGVFPTDRDL